jgi:hypothetical protein
MILKLLKAYSYIPVIPAPRRLRQEDQEFKASVGYVARPCLKQTKQTLLIELVFTKYLSKIPWSI